MKKRKLVIIHFHPLERFPPAMNLLDFLIAKADSNIVVISTANKKGGNLEKYENASIKIIRTPAITPDSFFRLFNYAFFYFYSLWTLIWIRPSVVLYYETLSSWPALLYKKLRGNKVKLFLHCHEYTSPEDYNNMWLVKQMHKKEIKMYPNAFDWISHTNPLRMEQFKKDHVLQKVNHEIFHIMPNYPPREWSVNTNNFGAGDKIRLVFAGSLGYENMYLSEIVNWVSVNKEKVSLDFYSYNIDEKSKKFLESIQPSSVKLHHGCNYAKLPEILKQFDVGLVLYKSYNFNHVNGISNKVYEYLACGLDVWFPVDNTYMLSLARNNLFPKIIGLDFNNLESFNFEDAIKREGLNAANEQYFAENIYSEISNKIEELSSESE